MSKLQSKTIWIKHPLAIFTANNRDSHNGLVIKGDKILELVAKGQRPKCQIDEVFDASQHVVLPGLINTHHHFYQTLTRACPVAINKKLFPWLNALYPVWSKLTPEWHAVATQLALVELLMSGCTTVSDHHYVFPKSMESAIDQQVQIVQEIGMRATLTRGSMSLGKDDGGLPPQSVVQSEQQILEDSERLINRYHKKDKLIEVALAPCSPFSVSKELMQATAKLAKEHNVNLHTHLAETEDENHFCIQTFGQRPLDYLESVDWLHDRTWLAHGIHFTSDEIARMGQAKIGVCHCPSSNMLLASGIAKVNDLRAAGVKVGLGVDGSASNDHSNLIQEARQALLIQRLQYEADEFTHLDALTLATKGGANVLNRDDIGELSENKAADLALFKLDEARFSGSHDALAALLLSGASQADAVMVAGEWKVKAKQWLGGDLITLIDKHSNAARRLLNA